MPSIATNAITALFLAISPDLYFLSFPNLFNTAITFVSTFVLLTFFNVVYHLYIRPHVSSLRHVPTPPQPPVHTRLLTEHSPETMVQWMKEVPNNGFMRAFTYLNTEHLIATKPEVIKEIYALNAYTWNKPSKAREVLTMLIGEGLVTLEGSRHKAQRKLMQPSFNFRHIQELYPLFWTKTQVLVDMLSKTLTIPEVQNTIDIQDWMGRVTLDIIGSGGFGLEFNSITAPNSELVRQYRSMFESDESEFSKLLLTFLPIWLVKHIPTRRLEDIRISTSTIQSHMRKIVQERKKVLAHSDQKLAEKDILSVAMQAESYTDDELVDHSMTFLAAGQDTTSFALTCAMLELSQRPELQAKLRDEVRTVLPSPSSGAMITPTDIENLPWLTAVCNETLRYYPSVHNMGRINTTSDSIIAGVKIPRGTLIEIPVQAINRFQPGWAGTPYDPLEFHPERWIEQTGTEKDEGNAKLNPTGGAADPYSFMTFSRGTRSCIGEKFARGEMACILSGLVGRFEFELQGASGKGQPIENLYIHQGFTGHVMGGVWLKMKEVEGW